MSDNQKEPEEKNPFNKPVTVTLNYWHQIGTYSWISVDIDLQTTESVTNWDVELTPGQSQGLLGAIGSDPYERRIHSEVNPGDVCEVNSFVLKDGPALVVVMTLLKLGIDLGNQAEEFKFSELDKEKHLQPSLKNLQQKAQEVK